MSKFARTRKIVATLTVCTIGVPLFVLVVDAVRIAPTSAQGACPDVLVVGVDGTGGTGGASSLVRLHTDQYLGRHGYEVQHVAYPASFWPLGAYTYDESRRMGADGARQLIEATHRQCPGTRFEGIGHSQGAAALGDAATAIHAAGTVPDELIEVDLLSDSRHPGTGIETVLPGIVPGASMLGERGPHGAQAWSQICVERDGICDMPQPAQDPVGFIDSAIGYLTKHPSRYGPDLIDTEAPTTGPVVIPAPSSLPIAPILFPGPELLQVPAPLLEPGPLANLDDLTELADSVVRALTPPPYTPTPLRAYVPPEVAAVLPPEVANFTPPPLPQLPVFHPIGVLQ